MNDKVRIRPRRDLKHLAYMVEWYEGKKRKRENFKTKEEAEIKRQSLISEFNTKRALELLEAQGIKVKDDSKIRRYRINEAIFDFFEVKKQRAFDPTLLGPEKSNLNNFGAYVVEERKRVFVDQITLRDLECFREMMLSKKLQNSTIERRFNTVRSFLNYCVAHKYVEENEALKLDKLNIEDKPRTLWSYEEKEEMFKALPEWVEEYITVLDEMFCRPIEINRLKIKDVDLNNAVVILTSAKGNKVHKRPMALSPKALQIFRAVITKRHLEGLDNPEDVVFRNSKGNPVCTNAICKVIRECRKELKLNENLSAYGLRHTNITMLGRHGLGQALIAAAAGHRKVDTTKKYLHMDHKDLKNVVNFADQLKKRRA